MRCVNASGTPERARRVAVVWRRAWMWRERCVRRCARSLSPSSAAESPIGFGSDASDRRCGPSTRIQSLLACGPGEPEQRLLQVGRQHRQQIEEGASFGADRFVAGLVAVRGGCTTHTSHRKPSAVNDLCRSLLPRISGFENRQGATPRGFESFRLRPTALKTGVDRTVADSRGLGRGSAGGSVAVPRNRCGRRCHFDRSEAPPTEPQVPVARGDDIHSLASQSSSDRRWAAVRQADKPAVAPPV